MDTVEYIKKRYEELKPGKDSNGLGSLRETAFHDFSKMGIPSAKHEEWKYTRISSLFNKEFHLPSNQISPAITAKELNQFRLPGNEAANELFFINGIFSSEL